MSDKRQDAVYANGYDDGLEDGITYARRNDLPLGLTVEQAIERAAHVLAQYRDKPQYVNEAVAALILDALDWPYGNGQTPSDMKPLTGGSMPSASKQPDDPAHPEPSGRETP